MRDTRAGMPELLAAFERDGAFFAVVRLTLDGDTHDIEFGVPAADYKALRRILQTRPFDPPSKLPYRYFIHGGSVRIEQIKAKLVKYPELEYQAEGL